MDDLNFDLDISQLSGVDLQRLGVTVAQVRAVFADPLATIPPERGSPHPDVFQFFGFAASHRFLFVALTYDDRTRKLTALAVRVADDLTEIRSLLCPAGVS